MNRSNDDRGSLKDQFQHLSAEYERAQQGTAAARRAARLGQPYDDPNWQDPYVSQEEWRRAEYGRHDSRFAGNSFGRFERSGGSSAAYNDDCMRSAHDALPTGQPAEAGEWNSEDADDDEYGQTQDESANDSVIDGADESWRGAQGERQDQDYEDETHKPFEKFSSAFHAWLNGRG